MSILSFCLAIFIATLQHFILDFGSSVVYDGIKQIPDDITREIKFKEQQKVAALKKTVARRQVLFKKSFGEESPEMMGLQKEVAWVESCLTVINQNGVPEVESEDHVAIKVEAASFLISDCMKGVLFNTGSTNPKMETNLLEDFM
mmetsp:Transcript_8147/g.17251  ORF Transcript_8147/g.17251 Transcript_8147/m.17251 type:complete len:145 (+) Transcript_8147:88-522(+)